jgi:RNA polymerase sigma factor (sigma-70 family)
VDGLPVAEREVVGLVFYHGWTQAQIAELFQVDERTVRRRWQSACLRLNRLAGGELPRP